MVGRRQVDGIGSSPWWLVHFDGCIVFGSLVLTMELSFVIFDIGIDAALFFHRGCVINQSSLTREAFDVCQAQFRFTA